MNGKLINLSTMRELVVPACEVGRVVKYTGDMANLPGIGAVVGLRPAGAYQSYDVALDDGREFFGTFLDASRWLVLDEVATGHMLEVLRAGVAAKKATDQANKSAADQQFAKDIERLRAEHPHLQQGCGPVVAAKNIRAELKRAFPGVAFSVKTSKYSGGNSVRVSWVDGPNRQQVEPIANKYAGGHFDGMTDSYEHKRSPWIEVFGEARYVFCEREYSDRAVDAVIRRVCARLGGMDAIPTVADYRAGNLWKFKQSGGCDVEREIRAALAKHTYCLGVS